MISYYTHLNTKDNFDKEVLFSYFFEWLQTSKNKMNDLKYSNESSFEYKENRKCLKIEDFNEYHILGIQFTTSDNYKKAQFVVEILYDYENQTIDLGFYRELNEDSKNISALSLPKIFIELLQSSYIQKDYELELSHQPMYISYKEYLELIKKNYDLPLVILTKNEKCCVNPFKLAEKVFGMAHVICVHTKKYEPSIQIYYPNHEFETIDSTILNEIYKRILDYSIQEHSQSYGFDELIQARLHKEHESYKELENFYQLEFKQSQEELNEYEQLLIDTQNQYDSLMKRKQELEEQVNDSNLESILIMYQKDIKKQEIIMELIHKTLKSLADNEVYRKRDILNSILKENE